MTAKPFSSSLPVSPSMPDVSPLSHMTGAKSGFEASTPVSMTATTTSSNWEAALWLFQFA